VRSLIVYFALCWNASGLFAQTLANGFVGDIDPKGNVAFSLAFERVQDFNTADALNRFATTFQFHISPGNTPTTTSPLLRLRSSLPAISMKIS
jgi:hypothetical protein